MIMKKSVLLISAVSAAVSLSACDDLRFTAPLPLDVSVIVAGDESCNHISFPPVTENASLYHHTNPTDGYPTNDTVTKNGTYRIGTLLPSSRTNTTFVVNAQCFDAKKSLLDTATLRYAVNSKMTTSDVPVYIVTAKAGKLTVTY